MGRRRTMLDSDERTLAAAVTGFGGWVLLAVGLVQAATGIGSGREISEGRFDWASWWFVKVGATFLAGDQAWFFPICLAVLLTLWQSLRSQSSTEGAHGSLILRTRRRSVPAVLALLTVTLVYCFAAIAAVAVGSADWTRLPEILLVAAIAVLLGIAVGRSETRSRRRRLCDARRARGDAKRGLASLDEEGHIWAEPRVLRTLDFGSV